MTTTLTIRLPTELARAFKSKARARKTNPTAVLRRAALDYVKKDSAKNELNALQQHINAYAGTWDGYCSGEELMRKTRP